MTPLDGRDKDARIGEHRKAVKILARSLFRDMLRRQYGSSMVIALATELIELVRHGIRQQEEL
jgi:hypothetical protein